MPLIQVPDNRLSFIQSINIWCIYSSSTDTLFIFDVALEAIVKRSGVGVLVAFFMDLLAVTYF